MKKVLILSYALVILVSWTTKNIENFTYNAFKNQNSEIILEYNETPRKTQINKPQAYIKNIEKKKVLVMEKIGASQDMQDRVDYALKISNYDKDFVLILERESGFDPLAVNINDNKTKDSGIGQINHYFHPHIVNDPRYKDWKFQIDSAYELYINGTIFYGYKVRHTVENRFKIYYQEVMLSLNTKQ